MKICNQLIFQCFWVVKKEPHPIEKIFNNIKKLLLKHIKEQSKQPSNQTNSILNILLTQKNNDTNELNEEIICDELLTLLEAGFGTTAIMLSWTLFYILSTPKVYQKLTEELLLVLDDGSISSYNISDLIYLEAVIKEALRIQTIIPTTGVRLVQDDFFIGGYTLPKGTMLACCSYLVHINPEYYSNPNSFKPERFLGKKPLPYHWNPFGGGSRRCIGIHLAELEIKLIITTILTYTNLNLTNHNTTPSYENVFFAPKGGPQVIIT
ncbi:cytochrome P450 [Zooshikella ganghwensis]|uniref:Cytochrome P450 n=1 Tax=Zooshikella ganghwensis TaxID=202772 RepID=A0A4P9VN89_9GAMM|nr:cytochrome P450 [Zooshikella ganghwensis]RDH43402.1 cytochrome P450 [Zooshikella ganghwensis]